MSSTLDSMNRTWIPSARLIRELTEIAYYHAECSIPCGYEGRIAVVVESRYLALLGSELRASFVYAQEHAELAVLLRTLTLVEDGSGRVIVVFDRPVRDGSRS